ncbi:hypothetical protein K493DRAFT_95966 [Basidiobolus meristosporus CBS 931.73]|uniref:Uncharacterized protein n=1 Tax=Basidiobolus meristosporus CBS 931.73 TaxID=1314790 RepID=A0A1Y1X5Q0_9FUNG|nr:hypothetical protein K493DRAFT_95966 [Basidiobolus meristosporus CBS 931.73]|eukprot:ORX81113.1 hypothetical protein K493DRAFT_95966 [Basidiobolus meristosporus CBS 931.73]
MATLISWYRSATMPKEPLTELERDVEIARALNTGIDREQKATEFVTTSAQGLANLHLLSGRKAPCIEPVTTHQILPVELPCPQDLSSSTYRNDLSPDKLGVVGFVTETVSVVKDLISQRINQRRMSGQDPDAKEAAERREPPHPDDRPKLTPISQEPILVQKVKTLFPKPLVDDDGSPRYKIDNSWGYKSGGSNIDYDPIRHPSRAMAQDNH